MAPPTLLSFEQVAGAIRPRIDAALAGYVRFGADCPANLRDAISYSLLGPGKRLRPLLSLLAAEACGGEESAAMPAACAVEMIHAYSLIHDDLPAMDDDDLRRGRPSCHKAFDEATAILAGDALLARAFEVIAEHVRPPQVAAACCAVLGRAAGANALVGGQAADLAADQGEGDLDSLLAIHRRKTGALFRAALRLGALTAGAAQDQLDALDRYGEALGLAFQITDDLLDVQGDEQQLGKRVNKDADRGKLTFPGLVGVEASRARAEALVADACAALAPLARSTDLEALARHVGERNR